MSTLASSSSPHILPIPRQPSPLSFSSVSAHDPSSPPRPAVSTYSSGRSTSPSSSRISGTILSPQANLLPSYTVPLASPHTPILVPTEPLPDSLLLRSTFSSLEHSTTTLKRFTKSVLSATSTYLALLEQVEKAEDEVFAAIGELGRWLESGYGVNGEIWDDEIGIRKFRRDGRRREREEVEVRVENGLKAVKVELKRNGLAGGGAQANFDSTAKQFYHQTSVYLSPRPSNTASTFLSSPNGPASHALSQNTTSTSSTGSGSQISNTQQTSLGTSDLAQAHRLAQFDLVRYTHHSILLYATPPSSIACLDLLVGLYGWVGGMLGETPTKRDQATRLARPSTSSIDNRDQVVVSSSTHTLKISLSTSLEKLSRMRGDLLGAWATRDHQTTILEHEAHRRQAEVEGIFTYHESTTPDSHDVVSMTAVPSTGVEHKKQQKKTHKIHRSVGGRLRDLLSHSGSSISLAGLSGERGSRTSVDGALGSAFGSRMGLAAVISEESIEEEKITAPSLMRSPTVPFPSSRTTPPRPGLPSRHSIQSPRGEGYISPFIARGTDFTMPFESSPKLRLGRGSVVGEGLGYGGVGGVSGMGDEEEKREEVGRKKEGVLWGAGSWEGLTKGGGKGKWEKLWVVLDRSRIYEYRDAGSEKPETAHAVIDLKFASVREGRGTERRFVFEIVTPRQGRRLYQATSEVEMKHWLYAICNAIESCINGTWSVRTFDTSKLRTVSGSLDDHALPARSKLGLGFTSRLPPPSTPPSPRPPNPNRHSMPPSIDEDGPARDLFRRQRKTSLKKVLRQSAEIAGEKWSSVLGVGERNGRYSVGPGTLDMSRGSLDLVSRKPSAGRSRTSTAPATAPLPSIDSGIESSPGSTTTTRSSWLDTAQIHPEVDEDIQKRVLEMAGLGIGLLDTPPGAGRRIKSEGVETLKVLGEEMSRSKSAEERPLPPIQQEEIPDMKMLRRIADSPSNSRCADCGKGMKSSRWATLSLREMPMVLFICIRCCGIHRSLGTHISKPRSVDLDNWSVDSILLAKEWGNERGNTIWEREKPLDTILTDENIGDMIRAKYVAGRWLSEEARPRFGLPALSGQAVGRPI